MKSKINSITAITISMCIKPPPIISAKPNTHNITNNIIIPRINDIYIIPYILILIMLHELPLLLEVESFFYNIQNLT